MNSVVRVCLGQVMENSTYRSLYNEGIIFFSQSKRSGGGWARTGVETQQRDPDLGSIWSLCVDLTFGLFG